MIANVNHEILASLAHQLRTKSTSVDGCEHVRQQHPLGIVDRGVKGAPYGRQRDVGDARVQRRLAVTVREGVQGARKRAPFYDD